MSSWQAIGKQRYRVQEDVVYWEIAGEVTAADVHAISDVTVAIHRQYGNVYVICDATRPTEFLPEARLAMRQRHEPGRAVTAPSVVVGGSAVHRVLLTLVVRAIGLLGRNPPLVEFVATLSAAEQWLKGQRELRGQRQSPDAQS
ncbi:MAG TPA: hypothetical protein PKI03_22810 [Pseudomonadota bacterium]|nr:hypothetical protein [Pseudomonadota bacterium]